MLPCPFHIITGLDCPLCGSQRAAVCFLHGQFLEGLKYNYALIIIIPLMVMCCLVGFCNKTHRFDCLKHIIYSQSAKITYIVLFFGWWIVRNII